MQSHTAPLTNPISDTCSRLGIGRTLLYKLIKNGRIKTVKVGSRTLIPESELQRFVAEQMEQAGST